MSGRKSTPPRADPQETKPASTGRAHTGAYPYPQGCTSTPAYAYTRKGTRMTKKHFQALADHIRLELDRTGNTREDVAQAIALACASFNPRFDKQRFIAAATLPAKGEPGYVPS